MCVRLDAFGVCEGGGNRSLRVAVEVRMHLQNICSSVQPHTKSSERSPARACESGSVDTRASSASCSVGAQFHSAYVNIHTQTNLLPSYICLDGHVFNQRTTHSSAAHQQLSTTFMKQNFIRLRCTNVVVQVQNQNQCPVSDRVSWQHIDELVVGVKTTWCSGIDIAENKQCQ